MPKGHILDLTGRVFGRWTVLEFAGQEETPRPRWVGGYPRANYLWRVRCQCGSVRVKRATELLGKHRTKSCGCARWEGHVYRDPRHRRKHLLVKEVGHRFTRAEVQALHRAGRFPSRPRAFYVAMGQKGGRTRGWQRTFAKNARLLAALRRG